MTFNLALDQALPELIGLQLHYELSRTVVNIPSGMRIIVAAALNADGPSCAFIVSQPELVAYFSSFLTALADTKRHFEPRKTAFAQSGLKIGQNVRLLPKDEIYEYGGYFSDAPHLFKLKFIAGKNVGALFSFPFHQVMRLEPTKRKQPGGKALPSYKVEMPLSDIDRVLGIQSFGNAAVFQNAVIHQSAKKNVKDFFSIWDLYNPQNESSLKDLDDLPWGKINNKGEMHPEDNYQISGEPILSFAGRLSPIAEYCTRSTHNTKVVFTSNKKAVVKNSADVSTIVENQKLILITDFVNASEIEELRNQDIQIWKLSGEELLAGINQARLLILPIRRMLQATSNPYDRISSKLAASGVFQTIYENIAKLRREIDDVETRNIIIDGLQRVFWRCSELLDIPEQNYQDWLLGQLIEIEQKTKQLSTFIRSDLSALVLSTTNLIINTLLPDISKNSEKKFEELLTIISQNASPDSVLILARNSEAAKAAKNRLENTGCSAKCITYTDLDSIEGDGPEYETLITIGWPGGPLFMKALQSGIAKDVKSILYQHELRSLDAFFKQARRADSLLTPSPEVKSQITGLPTDVFQGMATEDETPQSSNLNPLPTQSQLTADISALADIFDVSWAARPTINYNRGTQSPPVKSRCVSLNNDFCIYLTEDASLSVISSGTREYKRKTVEELVLGDMLVFRGGSEKEILREIATSLFGTDYEMAFRTAGKWKNWLRSLGGSGIEIWRELVAAGLNRHHMTISMWLSDQDIIGPQNLNDILLIAKATKNQTNINEAALVANAVKEVRRLHVKAGFALTAIVMRALTKDTSATRDISSDVVRKFSNIRLFSVEEIDEDPQDVPQDLVNAPYPLWFFKGEITLDDLFPPEEGTNG